MVSGIHAPVYSQREAGPKITIPFDSLVLREITSSGNPATGNLTVKMLFDNRYPGKATVHLKLGAFDDFGMVDDRGTKYKLFTSENLRGTAGINKGYQKVAAVEFGGKKSSSFMYAQQLIPAGEGKTLVIRLSGVNKGITKIASLHFRCRLMVDGKPMGEKMYQVEDVSVNWRK